MSDYIFYGKYKGFSRNDNSNIVCNNISPAFGYCPPQGVGIEPIFSDKILVKELGQDLPTYSACGSYFNGVDNRSWGSACRVNTYNSSRGITVYSIVDASNGEFLDQLPLGHPLLASSQGLTRCDPSWNGNILILNLDDYNLNENPQDTKSPITLESASEWLNSNLDSSLEINFYAFKCLTSLNCSSAPPGCDGGMNVITNFPQGMRGIHVNRQGVFKITNKYGLGKLTSKLLSSSSIGFELYKRNPNAPSNKIENGVTYIPDNRIEDSINLNQKIYLVKNTPLNLTSLSVSNRPIKWIRFKKADYGFNLTNLDIIEPNIVNNTISAISSYGKTFSLLGYVKGDANYKSFARLYNFELSKPFLQ